MKQESQSCLKANNRWWKKILSVLLSASMLCTMICGITVPATAESYYLLSPITGTVQGTGYDENSGHYGIDLYPYNYGDPVYAVASGTIMYSCERNHTKAIQSGDDCGTVKIILDEPITYNGMTYVCAFYTHMSALVYDIYCGYKDACVEEYNAGLRTNALPSESVHVEAGDLIGYVGKGNGATHLHFSFEAAESDGYAMMPNSEYYDIFGWTYNGDITAQTCDTMNTDYSLMTTSTVTGVKAKLDTFIKSYPNGSRWITSNGADATFDNSYECYGFAGLVVYNIFGKNSSGKYRWWNYSGVSTSGMITVGSITNFSADNVKSLLSNAKCGDVLQFDEPKQHSMIVYSVASDGMTIYDCNWDLNNGIRLIKLSYGAWSGRNSKKLTLLRSDNYSTIGDDTPVISDTCTCSTSYAGTYTCTTSTYPLTIRSGHGTSYSAIGSIPSGATVTVTKANGTWAHVTYNGVSGYASMEYLTQPLQVNSKYPVPFKCYPLSSADHAADAYDAVNGNHIGYVYGTDYCTVKAVYDNGWCLVNCPWGSGTKDVYALTSCFLKITASPYTEVVQTKADTYIRLGSSSTLGWVDKGDRVTIVDKTSARAQVIYPHTDGTYRCAWVDYNAAFSHTHTPGTAATCTSPQVCTTCDAILVSATGHSAGSAATCTTAQKCTKCGIILSDAKGHTAGAAATCTTAQKCTVCGVTLNAAKGHTAGAAATCTTAQKCTVCGVTLNAAKGHTAGAAATCTTAQKCTVCGVTLNAAKGHTAGAAATCTTAQKCTVCGVTLTAAKGHTPGAVATCTTAQKCTVCGVTLSAAKGHTAGAAATCTTAQKCTVCGVTLTAAKGHTAGAAATCTTAQKCTVCGVTLTAAKGHTPGAAATCTTAQKCTVCGVTIDPAKGHSYTAGEYIDPAHPHTIYYICECGEKKDSGTTSKVSGCTECYPATLTSISIESMPNKTIYKIGDTLDTTGLKLKLTYSDGSTGSATSGFTTSGFSSTSAGTKTVIVSYNGKTSTFKVTVEEVSMSGARYEMTDATGLVGSTVDIYVSIVNNPGIISLRNTITYDTSALELIAVEDCELLDKYTTPSPTSKSPYTLRWSDSLAEVDNSQNGRIVKLTFKIKEGTITGVYEVSVSHVEARNVSGTKVTFSSASTTVNVVDFKLGDVDGDGDVNDWDAVILQRYLSGWSVTIVEVASDIDDDGDVYDWDCVLLERYLAGWDMSEWNVKIGG